MNNTSRSAIGPGKVFAVSRAQLNNWQALWEALTPHEQARVVGLLVARVDFDGSKGKLKIGFHATGIQTLMDEMESGSFEGQVA